MPWNEYRCDMLAEVVEQRHGGLHGSFEGAELGIAADMNACVIKTIMRIVHGNGRGKLTETVRDRGVKNSTRSGGSMNIGGGGYT